jgi:hypothetical protein
MKPIRGAMAGAVLLACPVLMLAADPDPGCDGVNFAKEVLANLPNARALCRGVVERSDGLYVQFVAEVVESSETLTTVELLDRDERPISRVTFRPREGQMTWVEDSKITYGSLKSGTRHDYYIEHRRWGLHAAPEELPMAIVSVQPL